MIIWLNGPFGAGKTTLAELLKQQLPSAVLFDPEELGALIRRMVPESRSADFQDFPIWRQLVMNLATGIRLQFKRDLVIPMTLVNPTYLNEIFVELKAGDGAFFHFYLDIDRRILEERIRRQITVPNDSVRDAEVREWRLSQVERCLKAKTKMPPNTIFLNSGAKIADELLTEILQVVS